MAISDVVYPYTNEFDHVWVDPSGFLSTAQERCFICKRWTNRIDINFLGAFCNSYVCNLVIEMDLDQRTVFDEPTHV